MRYRFDQIAVNVKEKKKPVEEDKRYYIGLEHLNSGSLRVSRWGADVAPKGEKLLMQKGDVLFGKRRAYQKKVAIAPFDGIFSAHGMVLRPNEEIVDKDFFPMFISSDYFLDAANALSVGSLSPTINWRDLARAEFELPPMEKQRELGQLLWVMEDAKVEYQRLLAVTEELVKSRFVEMFGDPVTNPMGWEIATIGEIATDVKYGTSAKASDTGKYKYLRMNNLTYDGGLDLSDLKYIDVSDDELEKYVVRKGDILFNRTNSTELVGKTALFDFGEDMVIAGYIIRVRLQEKISPVFFTRFMNLEQMKTQLRTMAKGAVNQANINAQEMKSIKVYLPPLALQNEFATFVEQTDKSKLAIQETLEKHAAMKAAIMRTYFH